uniref:Uncharacterized protein n=1 Tax=viral metagenome TaxID=1070528 RepID=A0A6M3IPC0_9ZZZZ
MEDNKYEDKEELLPKDKEDQAIPIDTILTFSDIPKPPEENPPKPQYAEEPMVTCDLCKTYTGPRMKVRGHRIRCKGLPQVASERDRPAPNRKDRVPFGSPQSRLPGARNDGYHYRLFNDNWNKEPGRIQRALNAGYEVVQDFTAMAVGTNEDGTAIKGVLMRIPKELYEEDQKLKQKEVDLVDQAIRGGKIEKKEGDNRYIPTRYVPEGIRIVENQNENG